LLLRIISSSIPSSCSWEGRMLQLCVCFHILCPQPLTLGTHPSLSYPTAPGLCILHVRRWRSFWKPSTLTLLLDRTASVPVSEKPALLHLLILSLPSSPCHLHDVIFHLLGNTPTSKHYTRKVRKLITWTTDPSAYLQSSAKSWNPSSQVIGKPSFPPATSSQIINLDSDQITPPWTCLMLLMLSQQWMKALNIRHEISAVSLDISHAFDTVWHPAMLSKLSSTPYMDHWLPLLW